MLVTHRHELSQSFFLFENKKLREARALLTQPNTKSSRKIGHRWLLMHVLIYVITVLSSNAQPRDLQKTQGEPGVGWHNSPFLRETPSAIKSWSEIKKEKTEFTILPPPPTDAIYDIKKGDTLQGMMSSYGISKEEINKAIRALSKTFKPKHLKPGHRLFLQILPSPLPSEPTSLISLDFAANAKTDIALIRDGEGEFVAQRYARVLGRRIAFGAGTITSSLYRAGHSEGIPPAALLNLINILSFDVDFQRDIRVNDRFALLYERLTDETGSTADVGPVIYTRLKLKRKDIELYRFKTNASKVDYFDTNGRSVKKLLLSTPTDGARISSGFGRRRHPILGYTKLHKGIDFAAPAGTPVFAAGDGVIEVAKRFGSFGNYIRIRHRNSYKTVYAHLKAFAKGIRSGVRVRQRRVIGYIGSTGRSTGPHLHYEVIHNKRHVNPRGVRIPTGVTLNGPELKRFNSERRRIDKVIAAQRRSRDGYSVQDED
tara:strand:+ start:294 stop:1751 length:1458 start_codon:yes stop_codon:yes gene_type:complete